MYCIELRDTRECPIYRVKLGFTREKINEENIKEILSKYSRDIYKIYILLRFVYFIYGMCIFRRYSGNSY